MNYVSTFNVIGVGSGVQQYFSYIVLVSFIGEETEVPRENHTPTTNH